MFLIFFQFFIPKLCPSWRSRELELAPLGVFQLRREYIPLYDMFPYLITTERDLQSSFRCSIFRNVLYGFCSHILIPY